MTVFLIRLSKYYDLIVKKNNLRRPHNVEDLYENFIKAYFTPQLQDEIHQAFHYFDWFDFNEYDGLTFLLMREGNVNREYLQDNFLALIDSYCDYILHLHGVKLSVDANLSHRNNVLEALIRLMDNDCPELYLSVLDGGVDSLDVFTTLIELTTTLSASEAYLILEDVNPLMIKNLKSRLEEVMESREAKPNTKDIDQTVAKLLHYKDYTKNDRLLGIQLVGVGFLMHVDFSLYVAFIQPLLTKYTEDQHKDFVQDLYSVLLLCDKQEKTMYDYFKYAMSLMPVIINTQAYFDIDKYFNETHEGFMGYLASLAAMDKT